MKKIRSQNKSLKPTVTRVTPFAEKAKPAPRYGGLVPPLCAKEIKKDCEAHNVGR